MKKTVLKRIQQNIFKTCLSFGVNSYEFVEADLAR